MIFKPSISLLPLLLLLLACGKSKKQTTAQQTATVNQPPMAVDVYVVKPTAINEQIEVSGSLLANETTEIHPEISGRLVQLNIAEGKFVGKGALLAKIYDGDLQAQLRKLKVQLDIAKTNEERSAQLLKIQGISKADYDASLLNVNNINADMEIVRANITKTEIRAPFSGKLGLKMVSPGASVTPSTVLTTISQVSQLKLQFSVPEKYGPQMKVGQSVSFKVNGSEKTFLATVIATETTIGEETRTLNVRAVVRNNDPALIPGAFATVQLILGNIPNAILIPSLAVIPQGRKKQVYVFKSNKAIPMEITTGVRDSASVQVLTGLFPGDTLITSGLLFLKPGADVKLAKTKP
ncbi:MAG: efflux RND transporter periplasmic adaptor subunit [Chitinophagaceae bacterium]